MKFPVTLKQARFPRLPRKTPLSMEAKKIFKALLLTLLLLFVGSSVLFLLSRSESAQKGYFLRSIELQNAKLRSENEDLTKQVLEAQSYKLLEKSAVLKKMEPVAAIQYVKK